MAAPSPLAYVAETAEPAIPGAEVKRIRTVVVDDSPGFLQVACALLELEPLIDLIARASKGGEAIETVMKLQPDLVLMDVHMPYLDGLTLAGFFASRFPAARVILMSGENTPELREACQGSGALGFISKENLRQEFTAALNRVCLLGQET